MLRLKRCCVKENSLLKKKVKLFTNWIWSKWTTHIGTFGEVARTSMMVNAISQLTDIPTEIITFSDDMDGFRKVPENVPNQGVTK